MSQNEHLPDHVYDFVIANNPPVDPVIADLVAETADMGSIRSMQLGIDQAQYLAFMVGLLDARLVVEVGTFTGLSALMMARALPAGGRLVCFDISDEYTQTARRYWQRAGVDDRIELVIGPAHETLANYPSDEPVDLAFVDADKEGYVGYYEELVPRLSERGVIITDNVFMGAGSRGSAPILTAYVEHLQADPRTETVIVSIGDGFSLTRLV